MVSQPAFPESTSVPGPRAEPHLEPDPQAEAPGQEVGLFHGESRGVFRCGVCAESWGGTVPRAVSDRHSPVGPGAQAHWPPEPGVHRHPGAATVGHQRCVGAPPEPWALDVLERGCKHPALEVSGKVCAQPLDVVCQPAPQASALLVSQ